jgi:diguanylate cyclase (GGDEF)-like protein
VEELQITDLMTTSVSGIEPTTPLRSILATMAKHCHSCAIVIENDEPTGIITERDIVRLMLKTDTADDVLDWPAAYVMSSPVHTLSKTETLFDALVVSKTEKLRHLPIVDEHNKLCGIVTQSDLAAAHFRVVDLQSETIERAIKEHTKDLEQANKELRALSMEDGLLHIGNRRAMEVDLNHTHATALRYGRPYSIALVDVDYFKKYNDHYGHSAGDQALKSIAALFSDAMRASDRIYRYGGEELLILLADTSAEGAYIFIDRMIKRLAAGNIPHAKSPYGFITASAGVACAITDDNCLANWDMLVEKADEALYRAKHESRNTAQAA